MSQEIIDTGELPNDGTGDPLRQAFEKINNNFANLFALTQVEGEVVETSVFPESSNANTEMAGNINIGLLANNVYFTLPESASPLEIAAFDTFAYVANLTVPSGPYGNQEYINLGNTPNDGQGDPLRVAFNKINNNFSNLFFTTTVTANSFSAGLDSNQVIFETNASNFSQAQFQIRSSDPGTPDMLNINLSASITNNLDGVKFTAYGTTFEGNALCRYDMDVEAGNVRILVNPLQDTVILHFIAAQITWIGEPAPGVDIQLDGYPAGNLLGTQTDLIITTED